MLGSLSQIFRARTQCIAVQAGKKSCSLRCFSTTDGSKGGKESLPTDAGDDAEEDDEFSMEGFETLENEPEDLESVVEALSNETEDITPELASDLVSKMVEAAKKTIDKPRHGGNIISHISPHTVSVLRASRITTNHIKAAGSDYLPHAIEKRVSAEVNVDLLNLSQTAHEALRILSGPRWKGSYIKLSCSDYPSMEENRTHIVSQIDRLIAGAKNAVGEEVDTLPLRNWSDVVQEVNRQAKEEIEETGDVSLLVGEAKV